MNGFADYRRMVMEEINKSLLLIDEREFNAFLKELLERRRILVVAAGRVLLSMKAWVKRLLHLDLDINFVGSETEKPVGREDLLIVASSSGESIFPVGAAEIAGKAGALVAYIGCSPESSAAKLSDIKLILAGRTKLSRPGEFNSAQPMSTLFEQQLFILGDIIALCIMEAKNMGEADLKKRHANLE